jgi:phosphate transport system permease protein
VPLEALPILGECGRVPHRHHLFVISTQVPGMPAQQQYGTALILLILVLSLNISATLIRSYFRRRRQW